MLVILMVYLHAQGQLKWVSVAGKKPSVALQPMLPDRAAIFSVDEQKLLQALHSAGSTPATAAIVEVPLADRTTRSFRVWRSAIMQDELAARYPGIATYTAIATDDPLVTAKLDYTAYGFHAMIYGADVQFVDPATGNAQGLYAAHYKSDEHREAGAIMPCSVTSDIANAAATRMNLANKPAHKLSNGTQLRTYRLALSCDYPYASAVTGIANPTIAQVLSKMVTTMNRVNGVYERELSVTMEFVAHEDDLIWNAPSGGPNGDDPFAAYNAIAGNCLGENQTICDSRIGIANYDIGHVFTTGESGLSQIGVVCDRYMKAQSVTGQPQPWGDGFDIDYVSHEMGHEFGANHPFNDQNSGNCNPDNINDSTAYEPGSGSTVMAYAGICSPDDLQPHSDAYFHAISLQEIHQYINTGGSGCGVLTPTNNKPVALLSFTNSYTIPYLTPFELTAPVATDSVADTLTTYCWEQWNRGDYGARFKDTHDRGPIFRSFSPVKAPTRVFPNMTMVLVDSLSNAGTQNAQGEKVPDVSRFLTFKLTVRDIFKGNGCFLTPDDTMHLDVINTGKGGFAVTSQTMPGNLYPGFTPLNVTWNVAATNISPISADKVDVYMSDDGGYHWPYHLGTYVNNGAAQVILPNPDTTITAARLKVKGNGNVFFNVNKTSFSVAHSDSAITSVRIFPSPAHSALRIYAGTLGPLQYRITDITGRTMTSGNVDGELDVPVFYWAHGVYVIRITDATHHVTTKKFVVE